MKTTDMKTTKEKPVEKLFTLVLKIGDETFKSSGISGAEALQNLPRPKKIMAKGTLTVGFGKLKKELLMRPVQIKRLFLSTRGTMAVHAKYLWLYTK